MRNRAFTLVEILVVVGIAGIIIVAAVTPLTYTVKTIRQAQKNFSASNRERFVINQIFQDARETVNINASSPFRVIHQDELGSNANDTLLLWARTPSYEGRSMTCVAYKMLPKSVLGTDLPEGLYRWVLSGDEQPDAVKEEDLKPEEGKLLLPGLTGIRFSVMVKSEWVDDYEGSSPQALRIVLEKKEGDEVSYEGWLPQF